MRPSVFTLTRKNAAASLAVINESKRDVVSIGRANAESFISDLNWLCLGSTDYQVGTIMAHEAA
jgi:hypothetical protein